IAMAGREVIALLRNTLARREAPQPEAFVSRAIREARAG
ncbi:MAG: LLM class flavin-dependent oxidoreductase, partial [Mesorhizobium sp.]